MTGRRARGAVFTPHEIGRQLVRAGAAGRAVRTVCDPAAGDGRLLTIARDELGDQVLCFGADLHEPRPAVPHVSWQVADTLVHGSAVWPDAPSDGFDLVIGNPPFRNQLEDETRLAADQRAQVEAQLGAIAKGYADTAAMFLVRACDLASPDGRIAMIMPLSYLAARDAAASRRRVLELATLDGIWVANERVFPDADVEVCALILDRSGPRRRKVRRWVGEGWAPIDPLEVDSDELADRPTWSHLIAAALGIPEVRLDHSRRLGDLVRATAGFRDQFYGLAPLVHESPCDPPPEHLAPVVTSGLIDPGSVAWGRRSARIAGRRWHRPVVDLGRLAHDAPLGRWVHERRHPKLLVATQTRVVEAAPDPEGLLIPSTPVIAVHADGGVLWRALAVLLAPPITAWALRQYTGAALSTGAVKLSARQVGDLPLPPDAIAWQRAADRLAEAHRRATIDRSVLLEVGEQMTAAYAAADEVTTWWASRLSVG